MAWFLFSSGIPLSKSASRLVVGVNGHGFEQDMGNWIVDTDSRHYELAIAVFRMKSV